MPTDNRRNQGPEDSEDYHLYLVEDNNDRLVNKTFVRRDSRNPDEQRPIYMKTGVVSRVKGSAYIEVGRTKVLVSVHEPKEIPGLSEFTANGELHCDFRFASFSGVTRRSLLVQADERDLSLTLKRALEPAVCRGEFPNCQVDIHALVIDDDGSSFTAAVTAAGVALADAGIPMYDIIGAVTVGIHGDEVFLDPSLEEEEYCLTSLVHSQPEKGLITMAFISSLGQISNVTLKGSLDPDRLITSIELLTDRCSKVAELSRIRLKRDVLKKCAEEEEATGVASAS